MLRPRRVREFVLAEQDAERGDVARAELADELVTERLGCVVDRGLVGAGGARLALERGEPLLAPLLEADARLRYELALVLLRLTLPQRAECRAKVAADPLVTSARGTPDAVDGTAGTAGDRLPRLPRGRGFPTAKIAGLTVPRPQASHRSSPPL